MKFTFASVVAALATVVAAKPSLTNSAFDVVPGQSFELKWIGATAPVTIELKTGSDPKALKTFSVLATGITGGSATVPIPKDLPSGQYAFAIRDGEGEDNTNYSGQFPLKGTAASSTASSSASVTSTSTSSSARSTTSSSGSTSTTLSVSTTASATNATASTSGTSTTTSSRSSATTAAGSTVTPPNNNSSGANIQSSLALVLLGAVAVAFLN